MSLPSLKSDLVLGWQVNSVRDPEYWRSADARPGAVEQEKYLIRVPAETVASHTAIIAQSGSGKSFFLGRLVEELMLRTRCRCIILDPNADFKKIDQVEPRSLWNNARYDVAGRLGKLPHESSREDFRKLWSKISIRIRGTESSQGNYEPLTLWLPSLSVDFLGEDLDPMLRSDLYHCHAVVQALDVAWDFSLKKEKVTKKIDLFDEAQKLFSHARRTRQDILRARLASKFALRDDISKESPTLEELSYNWVNKEIRDSIERMVAAPKYVSEIVERFYFGKIREYMAAGIVQTDIQLRPSRISDSRRIEVVDLPSLDKGTRLLAVNALLTAEWEAARKEWNRALENAQNEDFRVPTFIIVDEAHNLIPIEPQTKAQAVLRDQFRTIVAEGRKFGLFLIVVSQRPDKLDPMVLTECENKAIMRLSSEAILRVTRRMLGLEDLSQNLLKKSLEFESGRVLLVGPWCPEGPQIIYSAARRTIEGGRNLRKEHWAVPV